MGKKGRSGRKPERFCQRGHDKFEPYGTYIATDGRGNIYAECAACTRERERLARLKRKAHRKFGVKDDHKRVYKEAAEDGLGYG